MDGVVREMIDLAPAVTSFPYRERLQRNENKEKRGGRLAAYALLWAKPNQLYINELVKSVTEVEDKPFGQFWGLDAVRRACEAGIKPEEENCHRLADYARRQDAGTDRAAVSRLALKACRCAWQSR
jgi:hypothetical protein